MVKYTQEAIKYMKKKKKSSLVTKEIGNTENHITSHDGGCWEQAFVCISHKGINGLSCKCGV